MFQPKTDSTHENARAERFYAEIWPQAAMLMRTAISLTADSVEAEDLVQETLLKAFKSIDRLAPQTHPRAWLLTLLRHTWIDRWRKRDRRPDGQALGLDHAPQEQLTEERVGEHDDEWNEPDDLLTRFADQQIIDALRLLPEGYRWALMLVDVQSLTVEEAASALEVAPGTVKSRLHRGRAMLRDRLHEYASEHGWLKTNPTPKAQKG